MKALKATARRHGRNLAQEQRLIAALHVETTAVQAIRDQHADLEPEEYERRLLAARERQQRAYVAVYGENSLVRTFGVRPSPEEASLN